MHPEGARTTFVERQRIRELHDQLAAAGTDNPIEAVVARTGWSARTVARVVGWREPAPGLLAERWESALVAWRAECRAQRGALLAGVHPELPADWKYYRAGR